MGGLLSTEPAMVSEDVRIFVDNTIKQKRVVVFSKTYCPYARKAKSLLQQYAIDPAKLEIIEIEKRPDCSEIQSYMKEITGASTVPRVFIGGECIGGGDDTARLHESGKLLKLLEENGALAE